MIRRLLPGAPSPLGAGENLFSLPASIAIGGRTAPLPSTLPGGAPWPRITIVTASFNQGAYIEETILSVLGQDYPDVEYIVVDGGSTDSTLEVLERYRDRTAHTISERDRGQSDAINKGFRLATGQILTWLNSDDRLAPGALAAVALAFHESGADLVSGIVELHQDGKVVGRHMSAAFDGPLPLEDLLDLDAGWNAGQFFYQPEVFFSRALWDRAGGHVDEEAHFSMDYELWLRFAQAGARLHRIGRPLALFRIHPAQKTADRAFLDELRVVRNRFVLQHGVVRSRSVRRPPDFSRSLRIAFVNDLGFKYGAGIAHRRIATGFAMAGHVAGVFAVKELGEDDLLSKLAGFAPDLVLFGNLHGTGTSAEWVGRITKRWPSLWVLHDFWLLTGRCAYTAGCKSLHRGCDEACPTPEQYPSLPPIRIRSAWQGKQQLLRQGGLTLLANSSWTNAFAADAVRATLGSRAPRIETISLGLPVDHYRPLDRSAARSFFGIPESSFVIVFSASSLSEERKGAAILASAFRLVQDLDLALLVLGRPDLHMEVGAIPVFATGYLNDPQQVVLALNAANLLVGASSEETFGQVYAEAAACGIPSMAFRLTGVCDALIDGVTGISVPERSAEALAEAIRTAFAERNSTLLDLSAWGRLHAENEWSLEAAYGSVFSALRRLPSFETLGIPHRIHFPGAASRDASEASGTIWFPVSGISYREGPYPPDHPFAFHWCHGSRSALRVMVAQRGTVAIRLEYRNVLFSEIGCEVISHNQVVSVHRLPITDPGGVATIEATIELPTGIGEIELAFDRKLAPSEAESRELTVMLIGVAIESRAQARS